MRRLSVLAATATKSLQVEKRKMCGAIGDMQIAAPGPQTPNPRCVGKRFFSHERPDPFARRPNQVCDPYGQGGKPLSLEDSKQLLLTLSETWSLDCVGEGAPKALVGKYKHHDYVRASAFIAKIAAVGDLNNHYPEIILQRKLLFQEKRWEITTTIQCSTVTLGGLSRNDFLVAMLIDVEAGRPEVRQYLLGYETSST
jgi:pterin-4a-carbinolamine dehydratase